MPIRSVYDWELKCRFTVGRGKLRPEDFVDFLKSDTAADRVTQSRVLSDYRKVDFSELSSSDIETIKSFALGIIRKVEKVKEAIVVSDKLSYGLVRIYEGIVYSEKYEIRVFTDFDEAKRWLGFKPEDNVEARFPSFESS